MGGIGDGSSESSSRDNPAEHVGTHSGGIAGWRAWSGSGGIAGQTAGVDGSEAVLQAVTSTTSGRGIQLRRQVENVCFMVCRFLIGGNFGILGGCRSYVQRVLLFGSELGSLSPECLLVIVIEVQPDAGGNRDNDCRNGLKLQTIHQPAALIWADATRAWMAARNCAWVAIAVWPPLIWACAVEVSAM